MVSENKTIMQSLSSKVSEANKDQFMEVLKQKLDSTLLGYVKKVEGEEKPHVD